MVQGPWRCRPCLGGRTALPACRQPEAARARAAVPPQSSRGRQRSAEKRRRSNVGRLWAEGGLGPASPGSAGSETLIASRSFHCSERETRNGEVGYSDLLNPSSHRTTLSPDLAGGGDEGGQVSLGNRVGVLFYWAAQTLLRGRKMDPVTSTRSETFVNCWEVCEPRGETLARLPSVSEGQKKCLVIHKMGMQGTSSSFPSFLLHPSSGWRLKRWLGQCPKDSILASRHNHF